MRKGKGCGDQWIDHNKGGLVGQAARLEHLKEPRFHALPKPHIPKRA